MKKRRMGTCWNRRERKAEGWQFKVQVERPKERSWPAEEPEPAIQTHDVQLGVCEVDRHRKVESPSTKDVEIPKKRTETLLFHYIVQRQGICSHR